MSILNEKLVMTTSAHILWRRNKKIALLIACLFGPWTWVYTYNRNPGKAAVGIGSNLPLLASWITLAISLRTPPQDWPASDPWMAGEAVIYTAIPTFMVLFATWLVAILDTLMAKEWQLTEPRKREKMPALILAIFMGPWTWLYTYQVDHWKFWFSIVIVIGAFITEGLISNPISYAIAVLSGISVWVASIVIAVKRSDEWYKTYGDRILMGKLGKARDW